MTPTVVSLDPGSKRAGLVVRNGDQLVDHLLLVRHPDCTLQQWVDQVCHAFIDLYRQSWQAGSGRHAPPLLAACEEAVPPTPHMGLTNVRGILETGHVVGALMHTFGKELILVPPGGFGKHHRAAYPSALWGARETKGHGALQHCRSSWDVAGAALTLEKYEASRA